MPRNHRQTLAEVWDLVVQQLIDGTALPLENIFFKAEDDLPLYSDSVLSGGNA